MEKRNTFIENLGSAAQVLMRSAAYGQYPIACLSVWIEPAILLEQIHFFCDPNDRVIGYVTWAFLAPDVEERLIYDPDVLLHLSEWNEGDRLWIMDFVVHDHRIKDHISETFALFPDYEEAKSLRRRDDGSVRKIVTWYR